MTHLLRTIAIVFLAGAVTAGCSLFKEKEEPPLPGRRTAVLPEETSLRADRRLADHQIRLPRPSTNNAWPQNGGFPSHAMHHLALGKDPRVAWQASVGEGSSDEQRLLAQPVVGAGRVYTMDAEGTVRAFNAGSGQLLWSRDVLPESEDDGDLGGGVAYDKGRLYVTTGAAETLALDAATGKIIWRVNVGAPSRSAPTVADGRVFVVNIENQVRALNASNGRRIWTFSGASTPSTILGGASPAVSGNVVVVPLTSGDIVALRTDNGLQLWSERLAAFRRRNPVTNISDITANPVIDRGLVLAISNAGRLVAIDLRTGRRTWDVDVGGRHTPWVAGDYIYLLTTSGHLMAIMRKSGRIRWVIRLARFANSGDVEEGLVWAGPVLAGDRLIVAGSHGEALSVSPYTGEVIGWIRTGRGVMIQPLIAQNTIYFLTEGGQLRAMR